MKKNYQRSNFAVLGPQKGLNTEFLVCKSEFALSAATLPFETTVRVKFI